MFDGPLWHGSTVPHCTLRHPSQSNIRRAGRHQRPRVRRRPAAKSFPIVQGSSLLERSPFWSLVGLLPSTQGEARQVKIGAAPNKPAPTPVMLCIQVRCPPPGTMVVAPPRQQITVRDGRGNSRRKATIWSMTASDCYWSLPDAAPSGEPGSVVAAAKTFILDAIGVG
jgi:hypothetical protein